MYENVLNLICLLYPYADSHTIDGRLNKYALFLISGNGKWVQQHFGGGLGFDLGNIVSLGGLGGEVGQ